MSTNGRNGGGTPGEAERDPRLDRLYRDTAREEPPARLDAAILAAARREVGARPHAISARLRAWRVPVSIAAVVVASVSLVTLVREEGGGQLEERPSAVDRHSPPAQTAAAPPAPAAEAAKAPAGTQVPATAPAARDDAAPGAAASAKTTEEPARRAAELATAQPAKPESPAPPRAAMRQPQPFQAEPAERERRALNTTDLPQSTGAANPALGASGRGVEARAKTAEPAAPGPAASMMQRDQAAADAVGSLGAAPAVGAAAESAGMRSETRALRSERKPSDPARIAALLKEFGPQPPEKWLEKIEALKREGMTVEADGMLAEFRRRFPDHPVPPGLR